MKNLILTNAISSLMAKGAIVLNSSSALTSQGMTLGIGDAASPEVFTSIPEIGNIDGPGGTSNEIDVTDLSSTAKEFILGLSDEGDITADLNLIPKQTQHAQLLTLKDSGAETNFRLSFTDSPPSTWTFGAYVKGLPVSNGVDNVTKGSLTLRVTGSITRA